MTAPAIWSVFNRDGRLVLVVSDQPGGFRFARITDHDSASPQCPFATVQSYDATAENDLLTLMCRSVDLDDFLERLRAGGFRVVVGRPRPDRFARL